MDILTINAGSSSLKFGFFVTRPKLRLALQGQFERIGGTPAVKIKNTGRVLAQTTLPAGANHADCLAWLLRWLDQFGWSFDAVVHRVVHGGLQFKAPVVVTAEVLAELETLTALAPLHQPHNLASIHFLRAQRPKLPQVACFDTAFHTTQPAAAQMYALPRRLFDAGIRAYGFHGLSYQFISGQPELASLERVVVMHLGGGASACALHNGRSVASTMGFTALDGLVMGTRCGSIDPGVVLHLLRQGYTADDLESVLYKQSGMLGVSGLASADYRDVEAAAAQGDEAAQMALTLFADSVAENVARLMTRLGGADALVFTAGIGEHRAGLRTMVCDRLAWTGVRLDAQANAAGAKRLDAPGSSMQVLRIGTDEELMMAQHAQALLDPA